MASVHKKILMNATLTTDTAGTPDTLETQQVRFVGVVTVTNFVGTTLTAAIQHSADGVNWEDAVAFTAATGNTYESLPITLDLLPKVRANVTSVTVTGADVAIDLFYDKD